MADKTVSSTPPRKRRRWLRFLASVFLILIVLLVAIYFVGTSSGFIKTVLLPRVGKSINADVTVSDLSISPFKEVILHNLKVQPHGQETLVTAPDVRLRYSLMDIIRGKIHVDEVTLSGPTVTLVESPDGSTNLDPLTKSQKEKPQKPPEKKPSKPSKPTQIDIRKVALTDATIRKVKIYTNGNRDVTELSHVNVTLDDLKNGHSGKLALSADIKAENNPPGGTNGVLGAKLNGNFAFALTSDLKPASVKGQTRLEVTQAQGAFAELATLGADLDCDATPTEIKEIALRFQKGGNRLGEVRASGPFDMEKTEGRLDVQILSIDKQVLNLAGASSGIDFGTTTLNSTNQIQFSKAGSLITASGQFAANKIQVTRTNQTTPTLDFLARYDVTIYRAAKTALLRELTFTGTQKNNPLLRAELSSPMSLAWGKEANTVGDSTLNLTVSGLNLADWKPFLGENPPSGNVGLKMKLLSQQGGKQLTFDVNGQVENLSTALGSNQVKNAALTLQANGTASELKLFKLADYKLQLAQQNEPVLSISGSGIYDKAASSADFQVTLQTTLARVLQILPQPDVSVSAGTVELKAHLKQQQDNQTITGSLALNDLTGRVGKNDFLSFATTMDLDIAKGPQQIELRRVQGKLSEGGKPGGVFDIAGTYHLSHKSAQFTAKLSDLNQNGLRPFLEPLLAEKKLVSVAINATATTQYNPEGDSALKADLQVSNLVVSDPKNQFPATPLEAKMQCDTSLRKQVADVRQFQITLTPTQRAKNELKLNGQVDMSHTNAIQGNLKLAADSLDVTSYYDLFAKQEKPATPDKKPATASTKPSRSTTAAATPHAPEKEPEAKQLPFRNFTADVSIGRFYLREVEITNLHTATKIDGAHVLLNPFQLALNGGPITATADVDLGVPGYKYDASFSAQAVPLAPLLNSFEPERKDQMHGAFSAQAKVTGTGTTGASLQKSLSGQFDINSTNLNLSVINIKSPLIKAIISVVATIPELLRDPTAGVTSLLKDVTGLGGGGLADELKRSPIDAIIARGVVGSGRMDLQQAAVQSSAFRADAKGTVTLAEVLTNSPVNIPVSISLSQPIAQKIGISAQGANAGYAKLPDFYTLKGTVGQPKNDINKLALLGMAAKGVTTAVPDLVGGKAGGVLKGLQGLLPGQAPANTNTATNTATNQPPQTQSPVNDLLNNLFKKPKK